MQLFKIVSTALVSSVLAMASSPVVAATAHNSQAGAYGASSNAGDSTPSSPHVKHAAKHKGMRR